MNAGAQMKVWEDGEEEVSWDTTMTGELFELQKQPTGYDLSREDASNASESFFFQFFLNTSITL